MEIQLRKIVFIGWLLPAVALIPFFSDPAMAADDKPALQAEQGEKAATQAPPVTAGPADDYNRGTPRSAFKGFIEATRDGRFETAAAYLDLANLPRHLDSSDGPRLARELQTVLDRSLDVDPELLSADAAGNVEDGLEPQFESLGRIKTPRKTVDVILERVPRRDGTLIWKFSHRTVAEIPHLNVHYGLRHYEAYLSRFFPDVIILGWQLWQYGALVIGIVLAFVVAYVLSTIIRWLVKQRYRELGRQMEAQGMGPTRILIWMFLIDRIINHLGPSTSLKAILRHDTLGIIAVTWAAVRLVDLGFNLWASRLRNLGQESTIPILKPVRSFINISLVLLAFLVWLDNLGFNVGALLAGLGVGGFAVALAAQDTLKNLLGCVMILLDRPYQVGQRIVAKGHDGFVEDIGLRSTRVRLFSGSQVTVPNEQMATTDIENVDRRPYISRFCNIAIRLDTPLEKVEKALAIIEGILADHEGMDPDQPPRVYFSEFNRDSLNILFAYWFHPPEYWAYMAMSQKVNKRILHELGREGIQLALPSKAVMLDRPDKNSDEILSG